MRRIGLALVALLLVAPVLGGCPPEDPSTVDARPCAEAMALAEKGRCLEAGEALARCSGPDEADARAVAKSRCEQAPEPTASVPDPEPPEPTDPAPQPLPGPQPGPYPTPVPQPPQPPIIPPSTAMPRPFPLPPVPSQLPPMPWPHKPEPL